MWRNYLNIISRDRCQYHFQKPEVKEEDGSSNYRCGKDSTPTHWSQGCPSNVSIWLVSCPLSNRQTHAVQPPVGHLHCHPTLIPCSLLPPKSCSSLTLVCPSSSPQAPFSVRLNPTYLQGPFKFHYPHRASLEYHVPNKLSFSELSQHCYANPIICTNYRMSCVLC